MTTRVMESSPVLNGSSDGGEEGKGLRWSLTAHAISHEGFPPQVVSPGADTFRRQGRRSAVTDDDIQTECDPLLTTRVVEEEESQSKDNSRDRGNRFL